MFELWKRFFVVPSFLVVVFVCWHACLLVVVVVAVYHHNSQDYRTLEIPLSGESSAVTSKDARSDAARLNIFRQRRTLYSSSLTSKTAINHPQKGCWNSEETVQIGVLKQWSVHRNRAR